MHVPAHDAGLMTAKKPNGRSSSYIVGMDNVIGLRYFDVKLKLNGSTKEKH